MDKDNKMSVIKFVPAAVCLCAVMYLMLLPVKNIPHKKLLNKLYVDKWVHVGAFAALIFLISYPYYKSSMHPKERLNFFIKIGVAASLLGLITEVLQKYFVKGRSFDMMDWAADSLGVIIGFWSAAEFARLSNDVMYKRVTPLKLNSST